MLENTLNIAEYVFLLAGVGMLMAGIAQYGRRTQDWGGVVRMFYRRIDMTVEEFKWYRIGVACVVVAVLLRIVNFTFWPL